MVDYISKLVPDAYHGTSRANAQSIVGSRKFNPSRKPDCYLGDGVYFFEGAPGYAEWWAKKQFPKEDVCIILAAIKLGKCLDLANPQHIKLIISVKEIIESQGFTEKITDAFVINFIATKIDSEIETVKGVLISKKNGKVFSGSHFYKQQQIIICVRQQDCILNFKLLKGV